MAKRDARSLAKAGAREISAEALLSPASWDALRMERLLDEIQGARIVVLGDVGVDRYTVGSVDRISPEAPVPVVSVTQEVHKLGLAGNVADNVHALGGSAALIGVVGSDRGAQDLRALLREQQIAATGLVIDRARRTILKERVVSDRQQLLRIDYETLTDLAPAVRKQLASRVQRAVRQADALIIEDYAKGMLSRELCAAAIRAARAAGIPVVVDPNSKSELALYRGADGLTPNTREAEALSGIAIRDAASLERAGHAILEGASARWVVITRGKDGMALFQKGSHAPRLIPTTAREVYDVSGAGDTVIAVVAMALARKATLEDACILGNLAAGVEVGKRGTATVSPEEIRDALAYIKVG